LHLLPDYSDWPADVGFPAGSPALAARSENAQPQDVRRNSDFDSGVALRLVAAPLAFSGGAQADQHAAVAPRQAAPQAQIIEPAQARK
jgi:hypothetical protein